MNKETTMLSKLELSILSIMAVLLFAGFSIGMLVGCRTIPATTTTTVCASVTCYGK